MSGLTGTGGLSVPMGYTIQSNSNGYDITLSAQFTGTADVCLKVTNVIDQTIFNRLFILHDDDGDGALDVNAGTTTRDYQRRQICRPTTSFSPFILAAGPAAPTAGEVTIGGRAITANGRGITNVVITLTDSAGITRTARTTTFGRYQFREANAGETYIITAKGKRYSFNQPSQVLNINEDKINVNFVANP
jgi:hypothetical protein